jgi:hypothetical protein
MQFRLDQHVLISRSRRIFVLAIGTADRGAIDTGNHVPPCSSPTFKSGYRLNRAVLIAACISSGASASGLKVDHIEINTSSSIASFKPGGAFGVAIDGGAKDESRPVFMRGNRHALVAIGANRVAYRLRTELGIEAWHWSAHGHWSDDPRKQGYWIGDPTVVDKSNVSFGYRLPRRGNTFDEANDDG